MEFTCYEAGPFVFALQCTYCRFIKIESKYSLSSSSIFYAPLVYVHFKPYTFCAKNPSSVTQNICFSNASTTHNIYFSNFLAVSLRLSFSATS